RPHSSDAISRNKTRARADHGTDHDASRAIQSQPLNKLQLLTRGVRVVFHRRVSRRGRFHTQVRSQLFAQIAAPLHCNSRSTARSLFSRALKKAEDRLLRARL